MKRLSKNEEYELAELIQRKAMYDGVFVSQKIGAKRTMDIIFRVTVDYYKQDPNKVKSLDRHRHVLDCRQVGMYFMKKHTNASLNIIGKYYGRNEHTIVINSIQTVDNMISTDADYSTNVTQINRIICGELLKLDFEKDNKAA